MADVSKSGDRPATKLDEIEITPAMIEAGLAVIWSEMVGSELGPYFSGESLALLARKPRPRRSQHALVSY